MEARTTLDQRIATTPGVCGGRPRIAGHRIRVQDIAAWHELQGMTPDEIVSGYPQITLADVFAALAYYHSHRDEIQRQMKTEEALVSRFQRTASRRMRSKAVSSQSSSAKSRASERDIHVIPCRNGWAVTRDGAERALSIHSTQHEAIRSARRTAKLRKAELVIHARDGRIREKGPFDKDPTPPVKTKLR